MIPNLLEKNFLEEFDNSCIKIGKKYLKKKKYLQIIIKMLIYSLSQDYKNLEEVLSYYLIL